MGLFNDDSTLVQTPDIDSLPAPVVVGTPPKRSKGAAKPAPSTAPKAPPPTVDYAPVGGMVAVMYGAFLEAKYNYKLSQEQTTAIASALPPVLAKYLPEDFGFAEEAALAVAIGAPILDIYMRGLDNGEKG